jgi:DNA invertase Pin-like site-specific DNA recombinase
MTSEEGGAARKRRVAAGYTRQSKLKADKSDAGPHAQDEATKARAVERGCVFLGHYRDIGVSGYASGAERPDFARLLHDCRTGRIQEIVVFDVSRLSRRGSTETGPIVTELFGLGVTITSCTEGVFSPDSAADLGRLLSRLDSAHQDSRNRGDAISRSKRVAKEFGGWAGGAPPYGLVSVARTEVRHIEGRAVTVAVRTLRPSAPDSARTDEASVVRGMVEQVLRHKSRPHEGKKSARPGSINSVLAWLNQREVPARGGGPWRSATVKRVLSDPRIAGFAAEPLYRVGKDGAPTRTQSGYRIVRDPESHEPVTICEPIIPPAQWYELQEWLSERARGKGESRVQALLSGLGLLFCECGRPMTRSGDWYKCSRPPGTVEAGQHAGGCTIQREALDAHVVRRILDVFAASADVSDAQGVLREAAGRFAQGADHAADAARRGERGVLLSERVLVADELERLYDDLNRGIYSGSVGRRRFLADKKTLEERLDRLESCIAGTDGSGADGAEPRSEQFSDWLSRSGGMDSSEPGSWWHGASLEDRRRLITLVVDRITVTKAAYRGGVRRGCRVTERATVTFAGAEPTVRANLVRVAPRQRRTVRA